MKVGKYRAKACGVDFGSTQNGNEFVAVAFEVDGQVETWSGYLTDKSVERTLRALRLMGWQGNDLATLTVADLPGWVQVDIREDKDREGNVVTNDDGTPRTRIAWVNSITGMTSAPLPQNARQALALRLRKAVADAPVVAPTLEAPRPAAAARPAPSQDTPPPMPGDDEMPF